MKKFLAIIFALYSTASLAKMVFDPVTCLSINSQITQYQSNRVQCASLSMRRNRSQSYRNAQWQITLKKRITL